MKPINKECPEAELYHGRTRRRRKIVEKGERERGEEGEPRSNGDVRISAAQRHSLWKGVTLGKPCLRLAVNRKWRLKYKGIYSTGVF